MKLNRSAIPRVVSANGLRSHHTFFKGLRSLPFRSSFLIFAFVFTPAITLGQATEFTYVLNGVVLSGDVGRQIPPYLHEAVLEAETSLRQERHTTDGAIVFATWSEKDIPIEPHFELEIVDERLAGTTSGIMKTGEPVVKGVTKGAAVQLSITASGHEKFQRRVPIRPRHIVILDDILLVPLEVGSLATVVGRLQLEGEGEAGGVPIYVDEESVGITNEDGSFLLERIRHGDLELRATVPGYLEMRAKVEAPKSGRASCELRGFKLRYALVRWSFQPDGSRNFQRNVQTGMGVLSSCGLRRVSFNEGFRNVNGRSDFFVYQINDQLLIYNFDRNGDRNLGIARLNELTFDQVTQVPEVRFSTKRLTLNSGDFLLLKCYNPSQFAKMEVISMSTDPEEVKAWRETYRLESE